ncbi:Pycsar system effector family protein [Kitasatospora sp. NPDC057198]|uniref:Pycsar system effector family protein n=1 Tax=Kitasatospora sp. NPDC057198 TaxID=3346046 RepID=UPI003642D529
MTRRVRNRVHGRSSVARSRLGVESELIAQSLQTLITEAAADVQRADAKAGSICAIASTAGALEAAALGARSGFSPWEVALGILGGTGIVLALLLAAAALHPSLPSPDGPSRLSFLDVHGLTGQQLLSMVQRLSPCDLAVADSRKAVELAALAMRKYRLLRAATRSLEVGLLVAAVAVVIVLVRL